MSRDWLLGYLKRYRYKNYLIWILNNQNSSLHVIKTMNVGMNISFLLHFKDCLTALWNIIMLSPNFSLPLEPFQISSSILPTRIIYSPPSYSSFLFYGHLKMRSSTLNIIRQSKVSTSRLQSSSESGSMCHQTWYLCLMSRN